MTTRAMTCIECPKGCSLKVDIENCRVVQVTGTACPKGVQYAQAEVENPVRILTSAVLAQGLSLKMVPVRTDKPIPKSRVFEAMDEAKKIRVTGAVRTGDVVAFDFLGLGVNLVATRDCY